MSPTLALIPAKLTSVGVPNKNRKPIHGDKSCVDLAVAIAAQTCDRTVISTDSDIRHECWVLRRPAGIPDEMLAVVQHALASVPGPDDEIIVLLQPSSPLRTAETVKQAIRMLEANEQSTSVVSVSLSYPWEWSLIVGEDGHLYPSGPELLGHMPTRRQECDPTYQRDGVVYAFRRSTLSVWGDIYGDRAVPLYTPESESLSIDTPADWDEAVRRLSGGA